MQRTKTGSFALTLPLHCEGHHQDYLDKVFRAAGKMFNLLVADRKRSLFELEKTRAWRGVREALAELHASIGSCEPSPAQKSQMKVLYQQRQDLLVAHGFSEYSFQARIQKYRRHYRSLIGTHVAQKIATAVWKRFEAYLFGNGDKISFKPWTEFRSIEGKTNTSNIRYKDGVLFVGKKAVPVEIRDAPYIAEALSHRIKYSRVIRRPWHGKHQWLYSLQLVLEGEPPIKRSRETEEALHPLGSGRVGIDIGTQTIAFVGSGTARLEELSPAADMVYAKLRRIQRAMDRSRRANNPEFFQPDGTIVTRDKLPAGCLDRRGKRIWRESGRYKSLAAERRYLHAKLARVRKCQHQELATRMLSCGDTFFVETMSFRGLAKKAAYREPEPGERHKRRKRFGKSIANKAPASMVNILEEKVSRQGGSFQRINTWKAKASQYDHQSHAFKKKKLSQRMVKLADGAKVQRDLYSAFLLMCCNDTLDGFIQDMCEERFDAFKTMHDAEIQRLRHIHTPSSTGVRRIA